MNQQAFYRDTAIGEFQLGANGFLSYRSWGECRRTLQVQQHRRNQAMSHLLQNMEFAKRYPVVDLQNSCISGFDWASNRG